MNWWQIEVRGITSDGKMILDWCDLMDCHNHQSTEHCKDCPYTDHCQSTEKGLERLVKILEKRGSN